MSRQKGSITFTFTCFARSGLAYVTHRLLRTSAIILLHLDINTFLHRQKFTWPRMQIIQTIRPLHRRLFHPHSLHVYFSSMAAPRQTSEKATEDLTQAMGRLTTSDNGQPSTDDPKPSKSRWRTAKPKRSEPNTQEASARARSPKRKGTQAPSMGKPLAFRPAHKHRGTILLSFRRPSSRHPSYRHPPWHHHFFRHYSLNQPEQ